MTNHNAVWTPPELWSEADVDMEKPSSVVETLDDLVEERLEQRFGRQSVSEEERATARDTISLEMSETSNWVYFPWDDRVVRYPSQADHLSIRTWRNKNLVTEEEQQKLALAKVAIFGLSVGSNVAAQLAQSGIGGEFLLADADRISPSNLNRMRASMADVGIKKTVFVGRKMAEVDPYIKQTHLGDGYKGIATDEVLEQWSPDIIFDEVDNLSVKAMIRQTAQRLKVPVMMVGDIGERSIIDIERYDQPGTTPFNGKLTAETYQRLLADNVKDPAEIMQLLVQLNGMENISERLFASATNPELGGLPQLGSTASAGAAMAERASRAILLGEELPSGTYIHNPDTTLRLS